MATGTVTATRVATGLQQPDFATAPPGDTSHLFIVEKAGQIVVLDLASHQVQPFLDLSSQVSTTGEEGLLGLAFDPNFAQTGRFFVDFTDRQGNTEVRGYQVSASNSTVADPASGHPVMTIGQPAGLANHKAGWIGFGPDGDLYVATGDGGGEGDPLGNGQNPASLLGKILRIDVGHDAFPGDPNRNYAIPADNPFVGHAGVAPEIWSLGLRNPWRDSFDTSTGKLYIADVGQDRYEEIDIGQGGANYGWNIYEGFSPYSAGTPTVGALTFPVSVYPHSGAAGNAIVGGYVVGGQYWFADFGDGHIYTLQQQQSGQWVTQDRTSQVVTDAGAISHPDSFALDGHGNLYLLDLDGDVWRLNTAAANTGLG